MKRFIKRSILMLLGACWTLFSMAQNSSEGYETTFKEGGIIIRCKVLSDKIISLIDIENTTEALVKIVIDDDTQGTPCGAGKHQPFPNKRVCSQVIVYEHGNPIHHLTSKKISKRWDVLNKPITQEIRIHTPETEDVVEENTTKDNVHKHTETLKQDEQVQNNVKKSINGDYLVNKFYSEIEHRIDFLSDGSIKDFEKEIEDHLISLTNWTDKSKYIEKEDLSDFITSEEKRLKEQSEDVGLFVDDFLNRYDDYDIKADFNVEYRLRTILESRIERRYVAVTELRDSVASINKHNADSNNEELDNEVFINIIIILVLLALLVVWMVIASKKRKRNKTISKQAEKSEDPSDKPTIVVRRKTTSIMKAQNIDDVIGNASYLKIDCAEFSYDSAVRTMYVKNSCIKDIYNMYAEDLRNPNNPKEDGCMVLGRWVLDEGTGKYDVTLEHAIMPGEDAVFKEFELNFGGKIKLRVAEKLRILRRETNLQYDLTCWIHSHPGLGVFFSNSDNSVHMQLKHPSHPKFLTAMVIDILTPQQDLGIFTFKQDLTVNSKNDINKLYSLEELYKWAVESDRNSFKKENHYNSMQNAELINDSCKAVYLSNGAIIDMSSMTTESVSGFAGWACGYRIIHDGKNEFVVNNVVSTSVASENEIVGCFIIDSHYSIPTIRKLIANKSENVKFVLFYSTSNEQLTTIPWSSDILGNYDKLISKIKFEDLKIWTRRKR